MVGTELTPWKVVQRLGTGSLTEAFLAEGPSGQAVLKRLLPFYADHELLSAAFILRGEEVRPLEHPAIVRVLETRTVGRDRFIVMERAEGRALSRAFARLEQRGWQALPQIPVVACAYQAAKALAFAHSRGVFHHDVSLHNLYLAPSGHVRVADFGLAQTRRQYAPDEGYVELVPPEMAAGAKPDARVDIWQLAASTYQLLAGGLPPDALSKGFLPLSERIEGADDTLSALLMKALSPIPSERPLAMAELVAAMGTWLDRVGVKDAAAAAAPLYRNLFEDGPEESGWSVPTVHPWPEEGKHKRVSTADEQTPTSPKALPDNKRRAKRLLLIAAGTVGALFLSLAAASQLMVHRHDQDGDPQLRETPKTAEKIAPEQTVAESVIQPQALPLSMSGVPAEFLVSPERHGFFLEDNEGYPFALRGLQSAQLSTSGLFVVPGLVVGDNHRLRQRLYESKGTFVVVTSFGARHLHFVEESPFELPDGAAEVRAGFFTDRTAETVSGNGQLQLSALNGPSSEVSLTKVPLFHLDDGERFTLSGLSPYQTYVLEIVGNARDEGLKLLALLKTEAPSDRPPPLKAVNGLAVGAAGQYLVRPGTYELSGASQILFSVPRDVSASRSVGAAPFVVRVRKATDGEDPIDAESARLSLAAYGVPATFKVTPRRHGFFVQQDEGVALRMLGFGNEKLSLLKGGEVPVVMEGDDPRSIATSGSFVVLTDKLMRRRLAFITGDRFKLPAGMVEARAGFFSDRPGLRHRGGARLAYAIQNGIGTYEPWANTRLFKLDEDERFTLSGLEPWQHYTLVVEGDANADGLVAVFKMRADATGVPTVTGGGGAFAPGNAGQYLLKPGTYDLYGATGAYFTVPRDGPLGSKPVNLRGAPSFDFTVTVTPSGEVASDVK